VENVAPSAKTYFIPHIVIQMVCAEVLRRPVVKATHGQTGVRAIRSVVLVPEPECAKKQIHYPRSRYLSLTAKTESRQGHATHRHVKLLKPVEQVSLRAMDTVTTITTIKVVPMMAVIAVESTL